MAETHRCHRAHARAHRPRRGTACRARAVRGRPRDRAGRAQREPTYRPVVGGHRKGGRPAARGARRHASFARRRVSQRARAR